MDLHTVVVEVAWVWGLRWLCHCGSVQLWGVMGSCSGCGVGCGAAWLQWRQRLGGCGGRAAVLGGWRLEAREERIVVL
ncbi:hypothetical protein HN51_055058, partial [Arachis hypogaea]